MKNIKSWHIPRYIIGQNVDNWLYEEYDMKNLVSTLLTTLITLASTGLAWAADLPEKSGFGLLSLIFFGFFAMIIAAQLVPGLILFLSGTKELFRKRVTHR